jgi:phytoene dehydrogenase-like protein
MTDVTVIGFGPAGASAAIAAHDAGASVTVLERMPYGGGNALNSGGFLFDVDGPDAVDHLDALCFGKTPRDVLEAFADGLHDTRRTSPGRWRSTERSRTSSAARRRRSPRSSRRCTAGAAGSIWAHLTEHGGGLTDAIVFGRVAGQTASS